MLMELAVSLVALTCIVAFVVWLAMLPQKRILQIAVPVCVVSFVIIYAFYLVARLVPDDPMFGIPAAFSAFVETFGSFTNGVAYSDVAESDRVMRVFSVFWFETLFWALHMLVIVSIAISGFAVFGRKFMDKVRYNLHRYFAKGDSAKNIYFIFGDSESALIFGKNLVEQGSCGKLETSDSEGASRKRKPFVVYFSYEYGEELREQIAEFGGALIEITENFRKKYLKQAEAVNKDNIVTFEGLVRPTVKVGDAENKDDSVSYDIADLLARKVVKDHAPYTRMLLSDSRDSSQGDESVDPELTIPERPYAAIIVGFGEIGRACLKQLIMTSQLTLNGTKPKFYVISRNGVSFERFLIENPGVGDCSDIVFLEADVYSFEAETVIDQAINDNRSSLCQVYVCCAPVQAATSEEGMAFRDMNKEIIQYLENLVECIDSTGSGASTALRIEFVNPCKEERDIWTPDIILHKGLDKRAIDLNYSYWLPDESKGQAELEKFKEETSPEDVWSSTCSLDRDSSRAAADFMEAFFVLLGIRPDDADSKSAYESMLKQEGILETLAQIEHNRWMAFHLCNGFTKMPKQDFEKRAKKQEVEDTAFSGNDKAHRDTKRRLHPCLVSWEELPGLDSVYALYEKDDKPLQKKDEDGPTKASKFVGK